jgi:hypothetical protein
VDGVEIIILGLEDREEELYHLDKKKNNEKL